MNLNQLLNEAFNVYKSSKHLQPYRRELVINILSGNSRVLDNMGNFTCCFVHKKRFDSIGMDRILQLKCGVLGLALLDLAEVVINKQLRTVRVGAILRKRGYGEQMVSVTRRISPKKARWFWLTLARKMDVMI